MSEQDLAHLLSLLNLTNPFQLQEESTIPATNPFEVQEETVTTPENNQVPEIQQTQAEETTNMVPPVIQSIHLEAIPKYDGNPSTLAVFISACEYILRTFSNLETPADPVNEYLLRVIINKLQGRALVLIGSREDATSWKRIKELLQQYFGDQRDENCLIRDLMALKPTKRESPYQFGIRCQDVRSLLLTRLKLQEADAAVRLVKTNLYDDLTLQTYLQGLPSHLSLSVRLRDPENLEKAMSLVIEEENFAYAQNRYPQAPYNHPISNRTIQASSQNILTNPFIGLPPQMPNSPLQRYNNFPTQRPQYQQMETPFAPRANPISMPRFNGPIPQAIFPRVPQNAGHTARNFAPNPMQSFARPNFPPPQQWSNKPPQPTQPQRQEYVPEPMETSTIQTRRSIRPKQLVSHYYQEDPYEQSYYDSPEEYGQYEHSTQNEYLEREEERENFQEDYIPDNQT